MIQFSNAANQLFSRIDTNQNGVSAKELKTLDADGNGKISSKEAEGLSKAELDLINRAYQAAGGAKAASDTVVFERVASANVPRSANNPSELSFPDKVATDPGQAPVDAAAAATSAPAASYQTSGKVMGVADGTGYYPANSKMEGGFKDKIGKPLHTLQDFLDGKAPYVSIALDKKLYAKGTIKYGDSFRIPELEARYGRPIVFKAVDTGGAFTNKGFGRVDICTRDRKHSLEPTVNGQLTLIKTQ